MLCSVWCLHTRRQSNDPNVFLDPRQNLKYIKEYILGYQNRVYFWEFLAFGVNHKIDKALWSFLDNDLRLLLWSLHTDPKPPFFVIFSTYFLVLHQCVSAIKYKDGKDGLFHK